MRQRDQFDRGHAPQRKLLRMIGPMVAVAGFIFTAIGIGSFFAAFGSFEPPRYFWCAFVGLPLLGIGGAITRFAYMGAIARYAANELAPVGKDTFNYLAEGTQDGVKTATRAIAEGLREGLGEAAAAAGRGGAPAVRVRCYKCNAENDADAHFCDACGAALTKSKPCPACGELNDPDARFCDNCGGALA
jgi:Double zinc ribbon